MCPEAQTRVSAAALIRTKIATVARLAVRSRPVCPKRHPRHHREDHHGGRARRQRVDRRSDRNADVEDREFQKRDPQNEPAIADVENDQQLLGPCAKPVQRLSRAALTEGGGDQERPGHAMVGEKRPKYERGRHADRSRIEHV